MKPEDQKKLFDLAKALGRALAGLCHEPIPGLK